MTANLGSFVAIVAAGALDDAREVRVLRHLGVALPAEGLAAATHGSAAHRLAMSSQLDAMVSPHPIDCAPRPRRTETEVTETAPGAPPSDAVSGPRLSRISGPMLLQAGLSAGSRGTVAAAKRRVKARRRTRDPRVERMPRF